MGKNAADCKWVWTRGGFHWACYGGGHHDIQPHSYANHMRAVALAQEHGYSMPPYPPEPEGGDEVVTDDDMLKAKELTDCKWLWAKEGFEWICDGNPPHDAQTNHATGVQGNKFTRQSTAEDCRWVWTRPYGFRFVCYGDDHNHHDVLHLPRSDESV